MKKFLTLISVLTLLTCSAICVCHAENKTETNTSPDELKATLTKVISEGNKETLKKVELLSKAINEAIENGKEKEFLQNLDKYTAGMQIPENLKKTAGNAIANGKEKEFLLACLQAMSM